MSNTTFAQIITAENDLTGIRASLAFGDMNARARAEKQLPKAQAKLFGMISALTADEAAAFGAYRAEVNAEVAARQAASKAEYDASPKAEYLRSVAQRYANRR